MRTKVLHIITFLIVTIIEAMAPMHAEHLIILATNDTHSQIEPTDYDNLGGVLRRRAFFDYMRVNNKNVLAIDAGDAVQGSSYYTLFKGEVEYALLDSLGYDISILGNHDFDNGIDELAKHYKNTKVTKLSTNYDFTGTAMQGVMKPYTIKEYEGKRIGIFGININPKGIISDDNYEGMVYHNVIEVVEKTEKYLKEIEKVDFIIMVSHIGYYPETVHEVGDSIIAAQSHYIDMIIGGYTHTLLKPGDSRTQVRNADGNIVTIGQNGKNGKYVGIYDIDLDDLSVRYDQVVMNAKWDEKAQYPAMNSWLNKYRVNVKYHDLMPVGYFSEYFISRKDYADWLINAQLDIAKNVFGIEDVTISFFGVGGIRQDLPKGFITYGHLSHVFPFSNYYVIAEVNGKTLKDIIERINELNSNNNIIYINPLPITQDVNNIEENSYYRIITVDYLANGGDHMISFHDNIIFTDYLKNGERLIDYFISKTIANEIVNAH